MKNTIPLQFLVGVTRLIAIYFVIRGVDQFMSGIISYRMMRESYMATGADMPLPTVTSFVVPSLLVFASIAVALWFLAPLICKMAIPKTSENEPQLDSQTCWNSTMIFLVGVLFVGVGITRISAVLITIVNVSRERVSVLGYSPDLVDKTNLVTTVILIGFGAILMKRFASIQRWIERKSCSSKLPTCSDENGDGMTK